MLFNHPMRLALNVDNGANIAKKLLFAQKIEKSSFFY
jgi:hypothetical protein